MAEDRLEFSTRSPRRAPRGGVGLALALVLVAGGVAVSRPWWTPSVPPGRVVEVTGDVPRPGLHLVAPPTAAVAVRAAGGDPAGIEDRPVAEGERVDWSGGRLRILPPASPVLVGIPIDLNAADALAISAVPGVSRERALAIVAEREVGGPFRDLEDLDRVPGLGRSLIERLRPFAVVSSPPPVDLGTATAARLERLPGIGPTLAERIVDDRERRGPCAALTDLLRVQGVTAEVVAGLEGRATCRPE